MEDDHITFEGLDGTECERFIQQIRKKAWGANRSKDNNWIIEFVSTCMMGPALRWYIQLDPDVAEDWGRLQRAMIERWPAKEAGEIAASSSIPTPAAAPEPQSDIIPSMTTLSLNAVKTGYIKVNCPDLGALYVSATLSNVSGKLAFGTSTSRSQALLVRFTQECTHRPLSMIMLNPPDPFPYLAVGQDTHGALGVNSAQWGLLVTSDGMRCCYPAASVRIEVWSVCPLDHSVRALWKADGSEYLLSALLSVTTRRLVFVSNVSAFRAKYPYAAYLDAELTFEAT